MRIYLLSYLAFTLLLVQQSCELERVPPEIDQPIYSFPQANFEIVSATNDGFEPSLVSFQSTSLNADSLKWDFGDPSSGNFNTSSLAEPDHLFTQPREYIVTLTAYNSLTLDSNRVSDKVIIKEAPKFVLSQEIGNASRGWAITQGMDNNYFAVGSTSIGDKTDLLVVRMDERGNPALTASRSYPQLGMSAEGLDITLNQDGSMAICGGVTDGDNENIWFSVINTELGEELFQ